MALDRQSIERTDFPIGRRGYDPEAVDSHLSWIARELEELKLASSRRTEKLSASASEQVRAIVEAAEASAARMVAEAESEAREIQLAAAAVVMRRLEALQSELSHLTDSLRPGALPGAGEYDTFAAGPAEGSTIPDAGAADVEKAESRRASSKAPGPVTPAGVDGDVEGARLIALNMALSGTSRAETDHYLAINFELSDRDHLLDEVYASVEG